MNNNSKTFRLFISSTFSDFQVERETLQTKIFPEIKEYCSTKGYTFQPIDLRWGVSNEAQLDQKALEMCIKEVQSCKTHAYPNFLIMLGDRYGWIPLPNIIEKNEFELITKNLKIKDKELLLDWYYEDKNQIPVSYILKQRTNEYIDYETWIKVESKLRDIFQNAVESLEDDTKNKYITSATESEAIEGIISYFIKTEYQKKLLELVPDLGQLDHKHIFGFFRNLDKNTAINDKFISDDYEKAQEFKDKVKKQLIDENILSVNTSQISEENLDISYLEKFTLSVMEFLKRQVDLQIAKDKDKNYSTLEIEKQQQYNYLNQKLENFLGQEDTLKKIENYINDDTDKPLIICGPSGIGKSTIIAQAIENATNPPNKKVIFRFVGATPNSTTTTDILTSILEELKISIEDEQVENKNQFLTDIDKEENHFANFSHKVYDEIMNFKDEIVVFLDAVDQVTNDDQFLWLPNQLPSNIKIVISALKDREYKEDSKYFYTLEDKISNYIEIEPFNKPLELLTSLLRVQKRTLQDKQKEYFLTQYHQVNTPLYVYMAANKMQYWKSSDKTGNDVTLSLSQKNIVKIFVENLTLKRHHDKLFVQKVFGYILASKDGLSEYEILELLNTDKKFIKQLAPDTWHTNTTQELPLVIWTRFYNHIKPFLSRKNQDGQELLYFFHREYIDAVQNQSTQQDEHEKIIKATQKMIEINQDKEFDSNRWGKLYVKLLGEYYFKYEQEEKTLELCKNINDIQNESWLTNFILSFQEKGWRLNTNNKFDEAFAYRKLTNLILEILNTKTSKWLYLYVQSLHNLASTLYRKNEIQEAINIEEKNIKVIEKLSEADRLNSIEFMKYENEITNEPNLKELASMMWTDSYLKILSVLSSCYSANNNIEEAIKIEEKSLHISESLLFKREEPFWIKHYLIALGNLSESLGRSDKKERAIKLLENALIIVKSKYDNESGYLAEDYGRILNSLSVLLIESAPRRSKELQAKSEDILSTLYKQNPNRYSDKLHIINTNKISISIDNGDIGNLEQYYNNSLKILDTMENNEKEKWIEDSSNELFVKSYEYYKEGKFEQSIKYLVLSKKIVENVYKQDQGYWAKFYVRQLIALGKVLNDNNQNENAKSFQEEAITICENYFNNNKIDWIDLYTKALNNLSHTNKALFLYNEALVLDKVNIDISFQFYKEDPEKWHRAYYHALTNISETYNLLENTSESDSYLKQSYDVKAEKFISLPEQFKDEAMQLLKDYDNAYKSEDTKELLKSLIYLEEFLKVCKAMYEKDVKWTAPYVDMLNRVAHGYTTCPTPQSGRKIRQYTNESLKIVKPLAIKYPDQWGPIYKNVIKNKRNLQKILYGTYIFGSIPIIIVIAIVYFIFE